MNFQRLTEEIEEFENVAFRTTFPNANARKKSMTFAAHSCSDESIAHILARCVDYIVKHPDWVRRDISLARQHIEVLRKKDHRSSG